MWLQRYTPFPTNARNSKSQNHIFTVSIKTARGPTLIHTIYDKGNFSFDSNMQNILKFPTLIGMLQYYHERCSNGSSEYSLLLGSEKCLGGELADYLKEYPHAI